jgi:hypothetical protein
MSQTSSKNSQVVTQCQICANKTLKSVMFLGYLPPVNEMIEIGKTVAERPSFPTEVLFCSECKLVQLGCAVNKEILFPPEYPYTSGMTRILHENFQDLYEESKTVVDYSDNPRVVDIGSNDGTLLSKFKAGGLKVFGIEPTGVYKLALEKGIPTKNAFFSPETAAEAKRENGSARLVTATNVFAHIDHIHGIVEGIINLLDDKGVFVSENHYLGSLVETLQYDTIYHEHLRYYSVTSVQNLLARHGLEVFHVKKIPTHGGSIRVYSARKGMYPVRDSVREILAQEERTSVSEKSLQEFGKKVFMSKLELNALVHDIKKKGGRIYGVGAPSRSSTLVNYVGLDNNSIDAVVEIKGSLKLGKYMPGTLIPVIEESALYEKQPEYAMLFSWHIAEELMPKIRAKGFKGKFIVPLPAPRVVD